MAARRPLAVRVRVTVVARKPIAVRVRITAVEHTAGQRLPMIVAHMDVPLRPMEAGVTTAGRCHRMEVVRTGAPCHPTAGVARPTAAVEGCRPMVVAVAAAAGRTVEVGDTPLAAVGTAVVVAAVDTAVAVDTEVATSEAWNCTVLTPSDFGRRFHCAIVELSRTAGIARPCPT